MENVIHRLTLDLTKPDMMPRAEVQQDNARTLVVSLTQGGRPYWIAEGVTAVFSARKPDGNPLFNACTIEKNRVRYEFTPQTTNVAGIVECEILLYSGDERILASPRFELAVDELIHKEGDVPESAPELSALTQMVAAGTAMIEDLRRALAGLEGVEDVLTQVASFAERAEDAAERAEKAAEEFGPGSVDMTGYAEKDWVREGFQPKGNYLTAAPVASVNGRTGKVLLSAPDVGARPDSWTPTAEEVGALPAETKIPGKTSELTNDSGFVDKAVSDLRNYYTKAQTQELIAAIPRFRVAVVQQLPSPGEELVLYLVPFAGTEGQYIEYIWVENRFEIIGIQQVDLTGYATEDWVRELLTDTAGDYLPMPKAYNAGAWLFAEEVDGKGNVSKTGTKVLDWVATHTSRVDPSDQVLVPEVTMTAGTSKAFNYDMLVGQTEVLVVCDGKLYLCTPKFDSDVSGDYVEYYFNLGNASLRSSAAANTGEPFFFWGYSGASSPIMAHFSTAGEHTIEIYGGKEVPIYNKLPEEYLPDGVVRTVNGVAPDENGNVNVDGAGPGQNATQYHIAGKTVVFFGDSICEGAGDTGGYAKPIREITGCITNNLGRSGATIANAGTSTYKIVNMVKEFSGDADMIVIEGGTNDCNQGVALGEIAEGYIAELDETTFCGALESIIRTLLTNHPQAQLFGIFTHRDVTDGYTNTNGVTKKAFRDKAVAIYEKYSLPYYDAYTDSGLITAYFTSSGTPAFFKTMADLYTYNGDKVHPNEAGYARYYVPQIIDMLERHCPIGETGGDTGGDTGVGTPTTTNADMSIVGFVRTAGTISTADTGRRTDYISMDGVQSITVKVGGYDSTCAVAFFDSSKTFLADISVQNYQEDGSQYGWIERTIDVTGDEYARAAYFIISSYHNSVADDVYNGDNDFSHDSASYTKTV